MSTAVADSMVDNSSRDNTGDAIEGAEVDANTTTLAKILDGTTATDLGGAAAVDYLALRVLDLDAAAGAVQTNLNIEWDPASGNMTDNSSGVGMGFKMPDDANAQETFARLDVLCVSDAAGAERGEFSLKVQPGSGTLTEVMTVQSGLTTTGTVINLSTAETTVVDGNILGRIDFQAPLDAAGTDANLVAASIWAEADDTFSASLNDTDLVFGVAESETAAERMRLSYDGTTVGLDFPGATKIGTGAGALTLTPATNVVVTSGKNLGVGTATTGYTQTGVSVTSSLHHRNDTASNYAGIVTEMQASNANASRVTFLKARASGTVVQENDRLGTLQFAGHDGTDYELGASIHAAVDGTPAGTATDMPTRLVMNVSADGSSTPTERFRISSGGNIWCGKGAIATNATAGFLAIPTCAGAATGTPVACGTNLSPVVFDTTNNRLYIYDDVADTWHYIAVTT